MAMAAMAAAAATRRLRAVVLRQSATGGLFLSSDAIHINVLRPSAVGALFAIHVNGLKRPMCTYEHYVKARDLANKITKVVNESPSEAAVKNICPLVLELAKNIHASPDKAHTEKVCILAGRIAKASQELPIQAAVDKIEPLVQDLVDCIFMSPNEVQATRARIIATHITTVSREMPVEVARVVVPPLVLELSNSILESSTEGPGSASLKGLVHLLERRMGRMESAAQNSNRFNVILNSVYICFLVGIPSAIYMVKVDQKNTEDRMEREMKRYKQELDELKSRVTAPEGGDNKTAGQNKTDEAEGSAPEGGDKTAGQNKSEEAEGSPEPSTQVVKGTWMDWMRGLGFKSQPVTKANDA